MASVALNRVSKEGNASGTYITKQDIDTLSHIARWGQINTGHLATIRGLETQDRSLIEDWEAHKKAKNSIGRRLGKLAQITEGAPVRSVRTGASAPLSYSLTPTGSALVGVRHRPTKGGPLSWMHSWAVADMGITAEVAGYKVWTKAEMEAGETMEGETVPLHSIFEDLIAPDFAIVGPEAMIPCIVMGADDPMTEIQGARELRGFPIAKVWVLTDIPRTARDAQRSGARALMTETDSHGRTVMRGMGLAAPEAQEALQKLGAVNSQ